MTNFACNSPFMLSSTTFVGHNKKDGGSTFNHNAFRSIMLIRTKQVIVFSSYGIVVFLIVLKRTSRWSSSFVVYAICFLIINKR
jgi:hypothetical protein